MEARQLEDEVEIEGGAPASVSDVGAASGADQIVSEGSQASGDVGVLADAGRRPRQSRRARSGCRSRSANGRGSIRSSAAAFGLTHLQQFDLLSN